MYVIYVIRFLKYLKNWYSLKTSVFNWIKVLVCNYGPGGNEAGGSMYKVGKPGSLCSNGSENGLCL